MGYEGGKVAHLVRPHLASAAARRMADHGGQRFLELVKQNTPIAPPPHPQEAAHWAKHRHGRKRGHARDSWAQKPVVKVADEYVTGVESHDEVVRYLEWGTQPHEIRPKPGTRRLKFWSRGAWHFPVVVDHPGTHGQAMTRISANKLEHEITMGLFDPILLRWKYESERPVR